MTVKHTKKTRMGQPVEIRLENVRILLHQHCNQSPPPCSFSILASIRSHLGSLQTWKSESSSLWSAGSRCFPFSFSGKLEISLHPHSCIITAAVDSVVNAVIPCKKNISFSQNNTNKGRGTDPAVCVAIWMEEPLHLSNGMKGRWTLRVWKHNILMHRSREAFKKGYDTPIIDLWHARLRRTNEICAQNNRIYFYFHRLNGVVERCNRIVRCCSVYPPPTTSHSVGNYILMVVRGDRL